MPCVLKEATAADNLAGASVTLDIKFGAHQHVFECLKPCLADSAAVTVV
jgi:hypothetical protein